MAEIYDWNVNADQNITPAPEGFPEGMPAAGINNAARELMAVIRRFHETLSGELVAGTRDGVAYTMTPWQAATAMASGLRFTFRVTRACADNPTLNIADTELRVRVSGLLKRVTTGGLVNLQANEIHPDGAYDVVYVPTEGFVVLSSLVVAGEGLTLGADDIPSLPASKITSGAFAAERIPAFNADKIASGTLDRARLPAFDATDFASGTLDADRLPALAPVLDTQLGTIWRGDRDLGTVLWAQDGSGGIAIGPNAVAVTLTANYADFNLFEIQVQPGVGDAPLGRDQHPVTNIIRIPGSAIGENRATAAILSGDAAEQLTVYKRRGNQFRFDGDGNDRLFGIIGFTYR